MRGVTIQRGLKCQPSSTPPKTMTDFCSLCSVAVTDLPDYGNRGRPADPPEWFQLVHAAPGWYGRLTGFSGAGYRAEGDVVIAPGNPGLMYNDPNPELGEFYPLDDGQDDGQDDVDMFLFHDACWKMLCDQAGCEIPYNTLQLALVVYWMLSRNRRTTGGLLCSQHEYEGVAQSTTRRRSMDPLEGMVEEGYGYCAADPSRFGSVSELFQYLGSLPQLEAGSRSDIASLASCRRQKDASSSDDLLEKLPVDVIYLVLTLLPSDDVRKLRLTSRAIASASRPDSLPQSFWRSRFLVGFEMWFALPIQIQGNHDWRKLYFRVRQALISSGNGSDRLRNRKRIWDIVGKSASVLGAHITE